MSLPIPVGRPPSVWDEDGVIEAIQRWRREHGKLPTCAEWTSSGEYWPNASRVRQIFGSWTAGIAAAGFEPRLRERTAPDRQYSDDDILTNIRRAFAEGERTSRPFMVGRRRPYLMAIIERFGSWNQAVAAAGVLHLQKGYYPELWDVEWLHEQYIGQGRSMMAIARSLGCSRTTVWHALRRAGIALRPPGRVRS